MENLFKFIYDQMVLPYTIKWSYDEIYTVYLYILFTKKMVIYIYIRI